MSRRVRLLLALAGTAFILSATACANPITGPHPGTCQGQASNMCP